MEIEIKIEALWWYEHLGLVVKHIGERDGMMEKLKKERDEHLKGLNN